MLGPTRTMVEDAAYGVRQLVDVALKALSPGINDPTTAQDAIFHLARCSRSELTSPIAASAYQGDGDRRLLMPEAFTDKQLAELAIGELRLAAADDPTVCIYIFEMIADVAEATSGSGPGRRSSWRRHRCSSPTRNMPSYPTTSCNGFGQRTRNGSAISGIRDLAAVRLPRAGSLVPPSRGPRGQDERRHRGRSVEEVKPVPWLVDVLERSTVITLAVRDHAGPRGRARRHHQQPRRHTPP